MRLSNFSDSLIFYIGKMGRRVSAGAKIAYALQRQVIYCFATSYCIFSQSTTDNYRKVITASILRCFLPQRYPNHSLVSLKLSHSACMHTSSMVFVIIYIILLIFIKLFIIIYSRNAEREPLTANHFLYYFTTENRCRAHRHNSDLYKSSYQKTLNTRALRLEAADKSAQAHGEGKKGITYEVLST